jgi:hypothetical protein
MILVYSGALLGMGAASFAVHAWWGGKATAGYLLSVAVYGLYSYFAGLGAGKDDDF